MIEWWSEDANFITPFDLHHFVYIFVVSVALVLLIGKREKVKENRNTIAMVILIISILQQIMLYSWYVFETGFDLSESLPLHISRINTLLVIYFLITKNSKVLDVLFYFSLFAYASFLYPQRVYAIYHIIGISFLVNHVITLLLPYFAYIAYRWRPNFIGLLKAYGFFLIYLMSVYFFNPLVDGNYFYLKYRPFFRGWPDYLYIPSIAIVTFLGFAIAYFIIRTIIRRGLTTKIDR
ncbi:TIGR02206 family membrane protein [Ornithinibacillus salinisoli]|uniref:TIGR02206 family membrane protein n=1 Tax=Ornithinibacillus salinisoli TaxID=1848459 RepID=A0ABW4VVH3_9BACI